MHHTQNGSAARTTLIVLAAIGAFIAVAVMLLPKGFSSDTSIIGRGSNVVVLAHNKDSVYSLNLMDIMNQVRGDYTGRIDFVVADANTPRGRAFIEKQQVELGTLLLFGPDGTRRGVVNAIKNQTELRTTLDSIFK